MRIAALCRDKSGCPMLPEHPGRARGVECWMLSDCWVSGRSTLRGASSARAAPAPLKLPHSRIFELVFATSHPRDLIPS